MLAAGWSEAAAAASAETTTAASIASRRVVVVVSAPAEQNRTLNPVFQELAEQTSVVPSVRRVERLELADLGTPAEDPQCVARVWIDLRASKWVLVYLHATASDRVLVRRIQRGPGEDELVREELEHILVTAIEGILKGSALGEPRPRALARLGIPARRPARATPVAEPSMLRLRAAAAYEVAAFAAEAPVAHGPVLALTGALTSGVGPGLLAQIGYRWPIQAESGPLSVTVRALVWGAQATLEPWRSRPLSLRFGLGPIAHSVWTEANAENGAALVRDRTLSHLAVVRTSAALLLEPSRRVSGFAALSLDTLLSATRFVVETAGGDRVVLEPRRFQPGLTLGALFP